MKVILSIIGGLMALLFGLTPVALAEDLTFPINLTAEDGVGESVGSVTLKDSDYGLILQPNLARLPEGVHGFHVHTNPNCEAAQKDGGLVPGLAAGGHFAPNGASHHAGPYGDGHLGDLPPLFVESSGVANVPLLAPRLTTSQVLGHSLIVHLGGDNFSDDPAPLGGGGARLACGVLESQ